MSNLRESSKQNWTSNDTLEQINAGSLQRIADATEKMASNYTQLQNDRDIYKRWYNEERAKVAKLLKSNAALRGHLKRLKALNQTN